MCSIHCIRTDGSVIAEHILIHDSILQLLTFDEEKVSNRFLSETDYFILQIHEFRDSFSAFSEHLLFKKGKCKVIIIDKNCSAIDMNYMQHLLKIIIYNSPMHNLMLTAESISDETSPILDAISNNLFVLKDRMTIGSYFDEWISIILLINALITNTTIKDVHIMFKIIDANFHQKLAYCFNAISFYRLFILLLHHNDCLDTIEIDVFSDYYEKNNSLIKQVEAEEFLLNELLEIKKFNRIKKEKTFCQLVSEHLAF